MCQSKKARWITGAVVVLIIIIAVILIWVIPWSKKPAPTQSEPLKIGYIGPLSGDAASVGGENLRGVELAVDELNAQGGQKFEVVAMDDHNSAKEDVDLYRQLVNARGIKYILTGLYGGFLALADQTEKDNTILISSVDASEELAGRGKNSFAIGIYDESVGYSVADYLNQLKVKKIGIMCNLEDPFMLLAKNALVKKFQGETQLENYNFNTKDYKTILGKFSDLDYIVLLGWKETGLIVRQAKELGAKAEIMGIDTFASEDFRNNTNGNYEGLKFSFWQGSEQNKLYADLVSKYKEKFQKEPDNVLFVATGYDAMKVLAKSLAVCGSTPSCVADWLNAKAKNIPGATGLITIDPDNITRSIRETIHVYQNDKIVELK